jgi:capsular exopolysaccharide synthesis family protein
MTPSTESGNTGHNVLPALRRHALLVVICGLLAGGITALVLAQRAPEFEGTARVLFDDPGPEFAVLGTTLPQSSDQERRAATNVAVIESGATAAAAAKRAGGITGDELRDATTVKPAGESNVVEIAVTAPSSRDAARRADAYARTAARRLRDHAQRRAQTLADELESRYEDLTPRQRRTGEGTTMRQQLFQLDALARSGTGSPRVVQRGEQEVARVDKPQQLIVLGIMLGLLAGAGLALLRERGDRRVRDGEDLAAEVPVLASVGRSKAIRRNKPFDELPEQDAEVFRFLHGKLRFAGNGSPPRTVLVTSACEGEGKTSVASYLASAATAAGARTLLIEADMRKPAQGDEPAAGLADVLDGSVSMDEAVRQVAVGRDRELDLLLAGGGSAEPGLLLQSEGMRELLEQARSVYDLVVIDSSPLGLVADALPLLTRVDGVLIAGFVGRSSARDVRRLRWQVTEMGGRVLGVVASNGRPGVSYGYAAHDTALAT